jgi:CRISPR-associated protein Cas1
MRQAEMVSNQRLHLKVVRKMYQIRFPDDDTSGMTTQQLRGREGSRVRRIYKEESKKWGVEWNGRSYDPDDFEGSDLVNQALSAGNVCLYGLAHAVITALGCSPGLGFIHVGHECSFVYDIADLYKAEITIPIAFEIASEAPEDLPGVVRRRVRDEIASEHLLERMVKDIHTLLQKDDEEGQAVTEADVTYLWDAKKGTVVNGRNYSEE